MGPDGALYIADWYNPIIQHGEVDFRDERRDRTHGRIWRVSFPEREADPWPEFATENVDGLLKLLRDPALPVRQFAREELWKRADQDPAKVLAKLTANGPPKTLETELWNYSGFTRSSACLSVINCLPCSTLLTLLAGEPCSAASGGAA